MKKTIITLLIVIILIAAAVSAGWLYFRANPDAWAGFQAELAGEKGSSSPKPVQKTTRNTGGLTASGSIEAEEITVSTDSGGRVTETAADEGDVVDAGQMLLQLDRAMLLAQQAGAAAAVEQAKAAEAAAQAQLDLALAGARDDDIAAAEGAVDMARGGVGAAEAGLSQAQTSAGIAQSIVVQQAQRGVEMAQAAVAQAEGGLDAAQADRDRAQAELARLQAGARDEEIAIYQALLDQAEALYWQPKHNHDELINKEHLGTLEEQARYQMLAAQGARDAAQAQLDLVKAGPTDEEVAAAQAVVRAAQAQVDIAQAGVDSAQAALAQAQTELESAQGQVDLAESGVLAAQAQQDTAYGQLLQAQAQLDNLKAGATPEEIATLRAQVAQAQAAQTAAEASLDAIDILLERTRIIAPSGGIVLQRLIHTGELASPGAPLFILADLDQVTLTVYVPEADLGQVSLGQEVDVTVDAYDQVFTGAVTHIASEAEFTPKNIQTQEERVHMVFAVKVRLGNSGHLLKPGMPADAAFR